MDHDRWSAVENYVVDLFVGADAELDATIEASDAAGLPAIQVAPTEGKFLNLIAQAIGARSILEIGTLGGYSTIWLARALGPDGRLVTLELVPKHAEVARSNIAGAGLSDVVEVVVGAATDSLSRLVEGDRGPFDLIFIDADKTGYPDYLEWALKLSRPGTVIVADNVIRDGEVIDPTSDDPNVQAVRRFNDLLAHEPRVSATAIQTVGAKGYDGFALAFVTKTDA
jgi:predicted O-methyltransferase YrrM